MIEAVIDRVGEGKGVAGVIVIKIVKFKGVGMDGEEGCCGV